MLRAVTIVLCLTTSAGAAAQVFKCIDNGKVTYSDSPCPGARVTQLDLQPTSAPPAPPRDPQAELQRQKALADQMANARHNRETQHQRTREHAARQIRARHQRCEKLRLEKKWADDDARHARDSELSNALHRKAARAAEALKAECPG